MIDWESSTTSILTNPRAPKAAPRLPTNGEFAHHVWIRTSGTTGGVRWVALSKEAILHSAEAVNSHLASDARDIWLNPLPHFHVGGLGIHARAYLSKASMRLFSGKWDPLKFHAALKGCTLTALVPSQLYDLVLRGFVPDKSLRAVIIGGGPLSEALFKKAKALGWPVAPSYGLTECASQVATARPGERRMQLLNHVEVREGICLEIKSASLLTAYATDDGTVMDPKQGGYFITSDKGKVSGRYLNILGRVGTAFKIGGEFVNLLHLENIFDEIKLGYGFTEEAYLAIVHDKRLGHAIHLVTNSRNVGLLVDSFNQNVYPYERIRNVQFFETLPKTALGKLALNPHLEKE